MTNILPINDLKEHIEDSTCECLPNVVFENGEMIVIHNSFDGREIIEEKEADLKERLKINNQLN